ncbi:MAG: hypothetical protein R3E50_00045 [Halioglobus sp.]
MNGFIADNLFQYVAARLLAEDLGYALEVSHSKMHPRSNVPRLLELLAHFRDAPLNLPGKRFTAPVDCTACVGYGGFDGFQLDLHAMAARRDDRMIRMAGYFQRYELIKPHKQRIRTWFDIEPRNRGFAISPEDIVVHVRMGDLVVLGWAVSLRFYTDILDRLNFRRLYICGFGLSEEVRRAFARYDPVYVSGNPIDDFCFMKGFNRIIQSNSGFSWWAGFLSQATEIHAPVMGPNPRTFDPKAALANLRVDDEDRYHYTCDVPYLERPFTLRDIIASRGQLRKKRVLGALRQLVMHRPRDS